MSILITVLDLVNQITWAPAEIIMPGVFAPTILDFNNDCLISPRMTK